MARPDADQEKTLLHLTGIATQWSNWMASGFSVNDGSALAQDDAANDKFAVSTAVITCLNAAIDHFHGFLALVLKTGFQHVNAPASVARGALESASVAVWIARPQDSSDRIRRALCWYWKDIKDGNQAATGANIEVPVPLEKRQQELLAVAADRGLTQSIRGYNSTDAVEAAKEHLGSEAPIDVLLTWRLCSGFAHARIWPLLGFADIVQIPIPDKSQIVAVRTTNSWDRIVWLALAAHQTVAAALALFDLRARDR